MAFREQRIQEIEEIRNLGINPYPTKFEKKDDVNSIRERFEKIADGEVTSEQVQTAGRVMSIREHGKSIFFHIRDFTGRIQCYTRADKILNSLKSTSQWETTLVFQV